MTDPSDRTSDRVGQNGPNSDQSRSDFGPESVQSSDLRTFALRAAIFRALCQGQHVRQVARQLGRAKQTVHYHAAQLEKIGAIVRVPSSRQSAVTFATGPRAAEFEAAVVRMTDRGVRSGTGPAVAPAHTQEQVPSEAEIRNESGAREGLAKAVSWQEGSPAWRAHGGSRSFSVVGGDVEAVPWADRWDASKVPNRALHFEFEGRRVRVWARRSKGGSWTVAAQPQELWVLPGEVADLRQAVSAWVGRAMREFASRHALELQERLVEEAPLEFALPLPVGGAVAAGVPGRDQVWIDNSPDSARREAEKRRVELETRSTEIVRAVGELPSWRPSVETRLEGLDASSLQSRSVLERVDRELAEARSLMDAVESRLVEVAELTRKSTELHALQLGIDADQLKRQLVDEAAARRDAEKAASPAPPGPEVA